MGMGMGPVGVMGGPMPMGGPMSDADARALAAGLPPLVPLATTSTKIPSYSVVSQDARRGPLPAGGGSINAAASIANITGMNMSYTGVVAPTFTSNTGTAPTAPYAPSTSGTIMSFPTAPVVGSYAAPYSGMPTNGFVANQGPPSFAPPFNAAPGTMSYPMPSSPMAAGSPMTTGMPMTASYAPSTGAMPPSL